MKIENAREAFLSDFEVLQHLLQVKEQYKIADKRGKHFKKHGPNLPDLEAIVRDTTTYLSQQTASRMTEANFAAIMKKLNEYELEKIEKLQIINQLPYSMVHLYAIVEECDTRFTEDQINDILATIATEVPPPVVEEEPEVEGEAQADGDVEVADA